jgi:hypothetical protein
VADAATVELPSKAPGLEINEVADGLVVYEDATERVHYLNNTASVVFELCTGENSEQEIATLLGRAFSLPSPPLADIHKCLDQLRSQGVVR